MKIIYFTLLSLSFNSFSNEYEQRDKELLLDNSRDKEVSRQEIYKYPQIYEFDEKLLKDLDSNTGAFTDTYYTKTDTGKIAVSYLFSVNIDSPNEVQSFDASFLRAFNNSYQNLWWGLQAKYSQIEIEVISDEATSTGDDRQDFTFIGAGIAHRFYTIGNVFNSDRVFEMISYYLGIVSHKDNLLDETRNGLGQNIEYSLSYRSGQGFFWGTKISYMWIFSQKEQEDNEKLEDRSNTFGHTSLGFEMGYIF